MTDPKETSKPAVATRIPKKKTTGIFDNLRTLPQPHPVEEMLGLTDTTTPTPSRPSTASSSSTPSRPPRPSTQLKQSVPKQTVAPERDFAKVANSIIRTAVPSGIFGEQGGKSKELYDALYSMTRGAVVPRRKIRIPKDQLMRKAGIGSEVTLRKNLARLRSARLINEAVVPGTHGGNEYEVFLPEEVSQTPSTPSTPSRGSTDSNPRQMREGVEPLASTGSRASLSHVDATVSSEDKTFFKDLRTIDDEAGAAIVRELKKLIEEITGREATPLEYSQMIEVIEVIALEGKMAASRTTVSSVGPFLAEHLRRRLFKKNKQEMAVEASSAPSQHLSPSTDIKQCPDCHGTSMYYPDGYEKGVARCNHKSLSESQVNTPSSGHSSG